MNKSPATHAAKAARSKTPKKVKVVASNKKIIQLAIKQVCLAGHVLQAERTNALKYLQACKMDHYIIMLQSGTGSLVSSLMVRSSKACMSCLKAC